MRFQPGLYLRQAAISRLANGKWVVLVPGGYFPEEHTTRTSFDTDARVAQRTAPCLCWMREDGSLIRELKTSDADTGGSVTSFGLTTPVLGDYQDDQVDDVAFAGDLAGNLWRFDLSDENQATGASIWSSREPGKMGTPHSPLR